VTNSGLVARPRHATGIAPLVLVTGGARCHTISNSNTGDVPCCTRPVKETQVAWNAIRHMYAMYGASYVCNTPLLCICQPENIFPNGNRKS
jgi:hypothetical protein